MLRYLFFLAVVLSRVSLSLDFCALSLAAARLDVAALERYRQEIHLGVQEGKFNPRAMEASVITSIDPINVSNGGDVNQGIYRVMIANKNYLMKLIPAGKKKGAGPDNFAVGLQIHQLLGEMGLAPRLLGEMPIDQTKLLKQQFPELQIEGRVSAIIMEEIPEAWNPKNTLKQQSVTPPWAKSLDKNNISLQLNHLKKTVIALGINPRDLQVFISKEGKLFLGDLDLYDLDALPKGAHYLSNVDSIFSELDANIREFIRD